MKRLGRGAVSAMLATSTLLLAGCSSPAPQDGDDRTQSTSGSSQASTARPGQSAPAVEPGTPTIDASSPGASAPGTATPDTAEAGSPAAGSALPLPAADRHYSTEELESALLAVRAVRGLGGRLVSQPELLAQADAAEAALAQAVIEPAACAALAADEAAALLSGGNAALLALEDGAAADTIAAVSYDDPAQPARQAAASERLLADCGSFTMTLADQEIATTAEGLQLGSGSAGGLSGVRTVAEAAGQSLETVSVSAVSGPNRIQVSITAPADADAAVREAEEMINALFTELARLP